MVYVATMSTSPPLKLINGGKNLWCLRFSLTSNLLYVNDAKESSIFELPADVEAIPRERELCRPLVDVLWVQGMQGWTFAKIELICAVLERAT